MYAVVLIRSASTRCFYICNEYHNIIMFSWRSKKKTIMWISLLSGANRDMDKMFCLDSKLTVLFVFLYWKLCCGYTHNNCLSKAILMSAYMRNKNTVCLDINPSQLSGVLIEKDQVPVFNLHNCIASPYNSACTNSNNALFIDVTNCSVLQHRCDIIDFGQTLLSEMCKMRYLTGKTSILLQISRVFLMFRS